MYRRLWQRHASFLVFVRAWINVAAASPVAAPAGVRVDPAKIADLAGVAADVDEGKLRHCCRRRGYLQMDGLSVMRLRDATGAQALRNHRSGWN